MSIYVCKDCGHEVVTMTGEKPEPIKWTDGRVCCVWEEVADEVYKETAQSAAVVETEAEEAEERPELELLGHDGNAFNILGLAKQAAKKAGWNKEKIDAFLEEAMAGDYDHLLVVCMNNFEVT